jgi:hypothetical protein
MEEDARLRGRAFAVAAGPVTSLPVGAFTVVAVPAVPFPVGAFTVVVAPDAWLSV